LGRLQQLLFLLWTVAMNGFACVSFAGIFVTLHNEARNYFSSLNIMLPDIRLILHLEKPTGKKNSYAIVMLGQRSYEWTNLAA
jgi:hypothetical protein